MRVSQIPEAEGVLIELGERPGDVDNLTRGIWLHNGWHGGLS